MRIFQRHSSVAVCQIWFCRYVATPDLLCWELTSVLLVTVVSSTSVLINSSKFVGKVLKYNWEEIKDIAFLWMKMCEKPIQPLTTYVFNASYIGYNQPVKQTRKASSVWASIISAQQGNAGFVPSINSSHS